jgi:hypothetical protein
VNIHRSALLIALIIGAVLLAANAVSVISEGEWLLPRTSY